MYRKQLFNYLPHAQEFRRIKRYNGRDASIPVWSEEDNAYVVVYDCVRAGRNGVPVTDEEAKRYLFG